MQIIAKADIFDQRFNNEFDAALRYDEAARRYKGSQAMPNFVILNARMRETLKEHFLENNHFILPSFYHLLEPGTMERVKALA